MSNQVEFDLECSTDRVIRIRVGEAIGFPLVRHVNKSNVRFKGRGRSPEWKRVAQYERAISGAARAQYHGEPISEFGLVVFVDVQLGELRDKLGRTRTGRSRARVTDSDGIKAVLDALNLIVYCDDRQIETVVSRIRERDDRIAHGDKVTIEVVIPRSEGERE